MKRSVALGAVLSALSALPAAAQSWSWFSFSTTTTTTTTRAVPEIDASTGLLAVAAVLAVLAFVWERRRRKSA